MTEWIGAAEAAQRLGIKPASLYSYVSRGVLSPRRGADGRDLGAALLPRRHAPVGRPRGARGAVHLLGTEGSLTAGVAGSFGFDAITVALLGRSRPGGVVAAGLLFGALQAGGVAMQARTGTPIDIVLVVQSLIVLFIAAPPLVRAIFRLRAPKVEESRA